MSCSYHTSNTINLVTATKYTAFGVMEYCVFVKNLVDCSATTHRVIFAKYVRSDYEAARSICCRTWLVFSRHQTPMRGSRCLDARIQGKLQQDAVCRLFKSLTIAIRLFTTSVTSGSPWTLISKTDAVQKVLEARIGAEGV